MMKEPLKNFLESSNKNSLPETHLKDGRKSKKLLQTNINFDYKNLCILCRLYF